MSKLPFELLLALRYLRPKRSFVSIITLISVLGVMLGVAVLIIVISVMSGFDAELREKVFGFTAHLKVVKTDNLGRATTMTNYVELSDIVAQHPSVVGVAPNVFGQVLLETQPEDGQALLRAPVVRGNDVEPEATVSELTNNIVAGDLDLSRRCLLIGGSMALDLGLRVGDQVSILSERHLRRMRQQEAEGKETYIPPDEYEVRGIFDAGHYEFNSLFVFMSLERAQALFGLEDNDEIHSLTVAIRDPFRATPVARELSEILGYGYRVTTWMQDSPMMQAVAV